MTILDWCILLGTLFFIVGYGAWKTRQNRNIEDFLLGDKKMKWHTIGLSVMATQASAITFLSTPGQAYEDGMRFIQFYLGLPIAMVIVAVTFIPIYYKLKVYTAYEYLESRFDLKTRLLAAFLFLIQRGLAAGITIYAPAIILSSIIGWNLSFTIFFVGILVIIYTVAGGTKAVSLTHKHQMAVMMGGMCVALVILLNYLSDYVSIGNAIKVAGKMGKMNALDFSFDINNRYNFWSGITGGLFLALAYFGTDQSQVQRYLSGSSISQSRLGLMFNGLLKIPMQFFILFIGVMVFVFYQYVQPPIFFNQSALNDIKQSEYVEDFNKLEQNYERTFETKKEKIHELVVAMDNNDEALVTVKQNEITNLTNEATEIRNEVKGLIKKVDSSSETDDTDYVFITFVMDFLPTGIIGLLLAVIFSAAMSSTSGELNALASTTTVDFYKRVFKKEASDKHYLVSSKLFTLMWGVLAISFAMFASLIDNLIEAVNILGSLFYGTILGIFLVAFYIKFIRSNAVFIAALISETLVIVAYFYSDIGFLWYNVIGCMLVVIISLLISGIHFRTK